MENGKVVGGPGTLKSAESFSVVILKVVRIYDRRFKKAISLVLI
jgi:hypothetical protein